MTPAEVLGAATAPESTQACSKCKTEHPINHFGRIGPGGPFKRCGTCRQPPRRHQKKTPGDPERTRRSNLRRLYGITPEEYDALRAKQDYRCAICLRHEDELTSRNSGRPRLDGKPSTPPVKLHVDHDHGTNEIRGLLCGTCNLGIANFDEQVDRMMLAIQYVQVWSRPRGVTQ